MDIKTSSSSAFHSYISGVDHSSSSSYAFPSYISGVYYFSSRCLCMWPVFVFFFNPTIEVVTFRIFGWFMLGVCLLPAFTCLGNECQDLLSPYDRMHVCTDLTSVYTIIWKEFLGNDVRTHVNSKGKSHLQKIFFRGISNPGRCTKQDSEPNTLPTSYSDPGYQNNIHCHENTEVKTQSGISTTWTKTHHHTATSTF